MSLGNFFKKDDEPSTSRVRPKLRPAPTAAALKERQGTGGKNKGGEATPKYDTTASDWNDQVAKFNKKGGINNDGRFGYGYVDTRTGIEVPWYIDMINGGGANAAGDTFVSPFEGIEGGLGGIAAQGVTGGLNAMGVAPYGSNRPRYFMPAEAARVDAEGKPVQVDLGQAPTGGGSPTVTPLIDNTPYGDAGFYDGMEVNRPVTPKTSDQAIGGYQYPTMYRPMDRQVGLFNQGQYSVSPMLPVGADNGVAELARLNQNHQLARASQKTQAPEVDPAMVGNDPSLVTARLRKDLINSMPQFYANTETDKLYRYYLQSGGTMPFSRWSKGER